MGFEPTTSGLKVQRSNQTELRSQSDFTNSPQKQNEWGRELFS